MYKSSIPQVHKKHIQEFLDSNCLRPLAYGEAQASACMAKLPPFKHRRTHRPISSTFMCRQMEESRAACKLN